MARPVPRLPPMPKPSLFLATPCYGGGAHVIYLRALLAFEAACAERGLQLHLELGGGEALISRARGAMMTQFLDSAASHLLFVDADIGFAPDHVFRLLEAEKDVIGGVYPRKRQAGGALELELEPLSPEPPAAGELRQVASVGAGFLLIRRSAAVKLQAGYPQLRARLGDVKAAAVPSAVMVFDSFVEPETRRYLSDHQAFCRRWRDLGGEVWADAGCRLRHVGDIVHSRVG